MIGKVFQFSPAAIRGHHLLPADPEEYKEEAAG
jgi:hypothetical protein